MTHAIGTFAFHLAIPVRDLQKSSEFYKTVFAMTPTLESDEVVLLTTPARREQLALQRSSNVTIDPRMWNQSAAHFGFVVEEGALREAEDAIRDAGGEVVARGSREIGPYLFFRDPDGYLVELFVDRAWRA